ncbi:MAG: type II toxin-antitoxin system VapC family toxin [Kineosporiaceae bacterium]
MIFLDTNVFVYARTESHYREGSVSLLDAVAEDPALAATSTAVLEELWHLELSRRIHGLTGATEAAYTLTRPVLAVTDEIFELALSLPASKLGANDRLHVATCLTHGIDVIVTADRAFDEAEPLRRIDPADVPAVRALLP